MLLNEITKIKIELFQQDIFKKIYKKMMLKIFNNYSLQTNRKIKNKNLRSKRKAIILKI